MYIMIAAAASHKQRFAETEARAVTLVNVGLEHFTSMCDKHDNAKKLRKVELDRGADQMQPRLIDCVSESGVAAAFVPPPLIEDPLARYRDMTPTQLKSTFTDLNTLKKVLGHVPTVSNPNPMVVPLLSLIADKGLLFPGGLTMPQLNAFRAYVGECGHGQMKRRALVALLTGKLE
jgi:hypothetical protein